MGAKKKTAAKPDNGPKQRLSSKSESERKAPVNSSPKGRDKAAKPSKGRNSDSAHPPPSRLPWRLIIVMSILAGGLAVIYTNDEAKARVEDVYVRHVQPQVRMLSEKVSEGLVSLRLMMDGESSPGHSEPKRGDSSPTEKPVPESKTTTTTPKPPTTTTTPKPTTTTTPKPPTTTTTPKPPTTTTTTTPPPTTTTTTPPPPTTTTTTPPPPTTTTTPPPPTTTTTPKPPTTTTTTTPPPTTTTTTPKPPTTTTTPPPPTTTTTTPKPPTTTTPPPPTTTTTPPPPTTTTTPKPPTTTTTPKPPTTTTTPKPPTTTTTPKPPTTTTTPPPTTTTTTTPPPTTTTKAPPSKADNSKTEKKVNVEPPSPEPKAPVMEGIKVKATPQTAEEKTADQKNAETGKKTVEESKSKDQKPAEKSADKSKENASNEKTAPKSTDKKDDQKTTEKGKDAPVNQKEVEKSKEKAKAEPAAKPEDSYAKSAITNAADFKIRDKLDEADLFFEEGKYEDALRKYDNLLRQQASSPRAQLGRAQTLDKMSTAKRSNQLLEQCITEFNKVFLQGGDVPAELVKIVGRRLADRQNFRGWGAKAAETLMTLGDRFPEDASIQKELGVSHMMINKNEAARQVFTKMLRHDPSDGFAQVHLGFIVKTQDNKMEEGITLLKAGIDSGAPGTQDGRFYFHLGDAYQRLGKDDEARQLFTKGTEIGLFLSPDQRSLYNVNTLTARPFWTPEQTGYQHYVKLLEDNWRVIRDEGLAQLDEKTGSFKPEAENLREMGDWKQLTLYQQGRQKADACAKMPKTCAIIEQIPEAKGNKRGQVKFSVMSPGVHVWPHCGPTNCRLRGHLGLVTPKGPKLRVVKQTKTWEEGKVFFFDDSFEHEVWHEGDSLRMVLIVDFWHPELTEAQRKSLAPI